MYTREQIDKANAMDVVEVARDLGLSLKRKGRFHFATCLWHEDSRPSMQVGGTQNTCHCYACGETHGVIDLVMRVRSCSFTDAMQWLSPPPSSLQGGRLTNQRSSWLHTPTKKSLPTRAIARMRSSNGGGLCPTEGKEVGGGLLFHLKEDGEVVNEVSYHGSVSDFYPSMDNSLSRCLLHFFPRDLVEWVTARYALGCRTDRMFVCGTMFPIIDREGRCHNIKVQEYDTHEDSPTFCHRKGVTVWLGTMLQKEGRLPQDVTFDNRVLFGEHLLLDTGTVALVESPKNAVVGACRWPELTWVAVGNKTALTAEMLSPLKGRNVLILPDKDALTDWQQRIASLRHIANFTFSTGWMAEVGEKGDVADWVLGT